MADSPEEHEQESQPAEPAEPDLSRQDEMVRGSGFRSWLWREAGDPEHHLHRLRDVIGQHTKPFHLSYSFDAYTRTLLELHPGEEGQELIDLLVVAETEWRAEQAALGAARKSLGLAPHGRINRLDWRVPQSDVNCGFVSAAGRSCHIEVVPGSTRCLKHGGALVDPEVRRAMLVSAYCAIVSAADTAVAALVNVAEHGKNELARVAAAKELLDRAGLTADLQVTVKLEGSERTQTLDRLRDKLDSMQRGLVARTIETSAVDADGDVIVESPPAPPSGNGHANGHGNGHGSLQ